MSLSEMKSCKAILEAIKEFNRLGREEFLKKYGFRYARQFFIDYEGRLYDSKAIVGVAHGYEFPTKGPLKPSEFSGGAATVKPKLEDLGFIVRIISK